MDSAWTLDGPRLVPGAEVRQGQAAGADRSLGAAHQAPASGPWPLRAPRGEIAKVRFFPAGPPRGCPVPAGGAQARAPGRGCRADTRTPVPVRTDSPRPHVGGLRLPPAGEPGCPERTGSRTRTHARSGPSPAAPPLRLARACADTPAGSAPTPTRNKERPVRTRSLGPAPPGRALGAGPAGGGSCDTAREAAELGGPRHILLRLRLLLPGSEPAEQSQAEPRAPRARAEQGTEPWRTRRASTVRAGGGRAAGGPGAEGLPRRCAAPGLRLLQRRWGSFLFSLQPRVAGGGTSGGRGLPVQRWVGVQAGTRLRRKFPCCGCPCGWRRLCVPIYGLCASPGAGAPGCAPLGRCARMFTRLVCTALCVPSWVHTHIHTPGVGCRDTVTWDHL